MDEHFALIGFDFSQPAVAGGDIPAAAVFVPDGADREGFGPANRRLLAAGLEPRAANGGYRMERAGAATRELLASDPPPTALISANNLMTIGVLKALRQLSVKIPDQVALVAIDDPFWADLVEPPLTTLAQPVRQLAGAAMSLLMERLSGRRRKPRRLVFPFELRVRRSCGVDRS